MRKYILIAFIAFLTNANAQIVFEQQYDSASTFSIWAMQGQLMVIKFEISGERYVRINRWGKTINIYNLNHSLVKTISLTSLPLEGGPGGTIGNVLYLSEKLFDTDSKIEFMYGILTPKAYTGIYNEDGVLLFSDTGSVAIKINYEQQQLPIYNTSAGTKMILSYSTNSSSVPMPARVFSLPGTLATGIQQGNEQLIQAQSVSDPYPNPTNTSTRVDYKLPEGISEGEIVFYDLQGKETKRFKVDKTFDHLLVSTIDLAAGTYYYQLQTTNQASEGKKMVVVK